MKKMGIHSRFRSILYPSTPYNRATTFVITFILIIALLVDTSLVKIYNFTVSGVSSTEILITTFVIISSIFVIGQYIILRFIDNRIKESKIEWTMSSIIYKIATISQFVLSGFLATIIVEIFFMSHYDTIILETVTIISYGLSIVTLGLLAKRLFSWFKSRKSYVVLIYASSSIVFIISSLFSIIFVSNIVLRISGVIESHGHNLLYFNNPGSFAFYVYNGYVISSIFSFILTWIATAMVLYRYPKRIGIIKYWVLISLPLVYFLSQFISLFLNLFASPLEQSPIFFGVLLSVLFPISKAVGGMLFGVAFWTMARTVKKPNIVRDYLVITAIGFILLFISDQAVSLIAAPYPPFGLTSVATVGLASYLILVGLYYSAISVSNDISLQKSISSSAKKEYNLLRTLGSAQREEQIEKVVSKIAKEQFNNINTPLTTSSEEDIRDYTAFVLDEIKKQKEKSK